MPTQGALSTTREGADALRGAGTLLLLVRALEQDLRTAGGSDPLNLTELGVLGQIERGANLPSLVARALQLDPARVTHISDRLVTQGYIVRTVDPSDRRRWRLDLTERGRERLEEGRNAVQLAMETLLAQLAAPDRHALQQGLGAVRELLDARRP